MGVRNSDRFELIRIPLPNQFGHSSCSMRNTWLPRMPDEPTIVCMYIVAVRLTRKRDDRVQQAGAAGAAGAGANIAKSNSVDQQKYGTISPSVLESLDARSMVVDWL